MSKKGESHSQRLKEVCGLFDELFYSVYRTRLTGGHSEPFYRAPSLDQDGEIQFTRDYFRSALHETAHWCVAGEDRLTRDDWGYWYAPDGRDARQQKAFYDVEVKPQALEWIFCDTCGENFSVSADNLDGSVEGLERFEKNVAKEKSRYLSVGLPERPAIWVEGLIRAFGSI